VHSAEDPSKGDATKTCAVKFVVASSGGGRPAVAYGSPDVVCQTQTPAASRARCHSSFSRILYVTIIGVYVKHLRRNGRNLPTLPDASGPIQKLVTLPFGKVLQKIFPILKNECIQIDKRTDAIGKALCNTAYYTTAIGMPA